MLDKIKLHFELMHNDPYKDLEVIHIDVKQIGIPSVVLVRTSSNKQFRKDKYGYFRYISTKVRKTKSKNTAPKPNKKRLAHA